MATVKDLLGNRTEVYSLREDATVHEAAMYLRDREIRATTVCDSSGCPVGVIAQSDISDKVAAENRCPAWLRVKEIMSVNLIIVTPETNVDECVRLMEKHKIFHLLVVGCIGPIHGNDLSPGRSSNGRSRRKGPSRSSAILGLPSPVISGRPKSGAYSLRGFYEAKRKQILRQR